MAGKNQPKLNLAFGVALVRSTRITSKPSGAASATTSGLSSSQPRRGWAISRPLASLRTTTPKPSLQLIRQGTFMRVQSAAGTFAPEACSPIPATSWPIIGKLGCLPLLSDSRIVFSNASRRNGSPMIWASMRKQAMLSRNGPSALIKATESRGSLPLRSRLDRACNCASGLSSVSLLEVSSGSEGLSSLRPAKI